MRYHEHSIQHSSDCAALCQIWSSTRVILGAPSFSTLMYIDLAEYLDLYVLLANSNNAIWCILFYKFIEVSITSDTHLQGVHGPCEVPHPLPAGKFKLTSLPQ